MKKKYLIYPGYVTSRNDGERHYISERQLIELYGVNPAECIIHGRQVDAITEKTLISLFPMSSGIYKIPKQPSNV